MFFCIHYWLLELQCYKIENLENLLQKCHFLYKIKSSTLNKTQVSESCQPEFIVQPCHLLVTTRWATFLLSRCFSFLIWKMKKIINPSYRVTEIVKWNNNIKYLEQCLACGNSYMKVRFHYPYAIILLWMSEINGSV